MTIGSTTERGTHAIKMYSMQEKIRQEQEREAWEDWARSMPEGALVPDTLPQTKERPPYWGIISFARSAMP